MKKYYKYLFILLLSIFMYIPKDTHAMGIRILGQNFKTIAECNNCSELTSKGEDLYEDVYQIYLTFDNLQFRSGSTYSVETTFFLNSLVDGVQYSSPNFWIGYGSVNIEQTVNQEYYRVNYQNQVSDPYFAAPVFKKNISFKGSFTSKTTGTGAIIELPFRSPITIRGITVDTYGIVNTGSNDGDIINNSTNTIIQNNNANTDRVVENDNKNHQEAEQTRKSIWNTIKELPSKFLEMLKSLFIPSDEFFKDFITDYKETLFEKLGFIGFPFKVLITLLNRYIYLETNPVISIPDIKEPFSGFVLIEARDYNIQEIFETSSIGTLYNIYMTFVGAYFIILFLNYCIKKYNEFVKARGDGF